MTMINRGVLWRYDSGALLYLPPYELSIDDEEQGDCEFQEISYYSTEGLVETYNRVNGIKLPVRGVYIFDDPAAGLAWQDQLRAFLRDSSGRGVRVALCKWMDTTETTGRFWWDCVLSGFVKFPQWQGARTDRLRAYEFDLMSLRPKSYRTWPDEAATQPAAGPYEIYLYNGEPTEGDPVVVINVESRQGMITGQFDGLLDEATNADNVSYRQQKIILSPTYAMWLRSLQTIGCGGVTGGSGDTARVSIGTGPYTGGGSKLSVNVPGNTGISPTVTTGSVLVAANTPVYVFVELQAGHQDLKWMALAERA